MPKKLSNDEAQAKLDAVWPENVPEMVSSDVQAALEASGSSYAVVTQLKAAGRLRGYVVLNPDGTTTHRLVRQS